LALPQPVPLPPNLPFCFYGFLSSVKCVPRAGIPMVAPFFLLFSFLVRFFFSFPIPIDVFSGRKGKRKLYTPFSPYPSPCLAHLPPSTLPRLYRHSLSSFPTSFFLFSFISHAFNVSLAPLGLWVVSHPNDMERSSCRSSFWHVAAPAILSPPLLPVSIGCPSPLLPRRPESSFPCIDKRPVIFDWSFRLFCRPLLLPEATYRASTSLKSVFFFPPTSLFSSPLS